MNVDKKTEKLNRLYQKKLGRPLDAEGYRAFQSSGFDLDAARREILATEEFQRKETVFGTLQERSKAIAGKPVVGGRDARKLQKSTYATPYTRESFIAEFKSLNRGADPDEKTVKNWLTNGIGVGQYAAETKYERDNVITIGVDKKGQRVTDPSVKAARVYKIHKNPDAFQKHFGSGLHQLGEDRKGAIQLVPTSGAEAVGRQGNLAKYGAIDPRHGLGGLLKQYGLDPAQFSVTQVIRPAPKRGFFQHSIPDQLAKATGIKEIGDLPLGDILSAATWGPGMYIAAEAAAKWDPNGLGRYFNPGILKKGADPFEVQGDALQEGYSAEADAATARALDTSVQNINKIDAVTSVLGDAALAYFTGGAAVAGKRAAQAAGRHASGQTSSQQFFTDLGWAAADAGLAYAGASPYFDASSSRAASLAATGFAKDVVEARTRGASWDDALTNAAWGQAGYARFARPLIDKEYAKQLERNPAALASYLSSAALTAYTRSQAGATGTNWLQRKGMEWGYGRVRDGKYQPGFYRPDAPVQPEPSPWVPSTWRTAREPGFWEQAREGNRQQSDRTSRRLYSLTHRSSLQSNREQPTNMRDPWARDFNTR